MVIRRFSIPRIAVFLLILTIATFAFAGDKVGKAGGGGQSIEWQVAISGHERIVLTVVAPDGQDYRSSFSSGKNPSFSVRDLASVEDGDYNYELRVEPKISGKVKSDLEKARKAGDDAAARAIMKAAGLSEVVQSGGFQIRNGAIVSPDNTESTARDSARIGNVSSTAATPSGENLASKRPDFAVGVNDQVIADDLIVQGSTCVGFDCVNNESFGFDTIRLKENNTRIKFEDTSASAGFPTTDWQLTANDSASGGQSKFSIEDITGAVVPFTVEASATTNSIYVDSTGRVGFRTSTPVLDLHVNTSNTPALRLEQNNSGGFTAQTWDVAGNEANFFVRDVTGGSRLPLRIRPGAATSSIDVSSDGNTGFGTASPHASSRVDLSDSTQLKARMVLTGQEFFAAANTSTDGVAMILGINRTNNRQLWIADSAAMAVNATNRVIRINPGPASADVAALFTNGTVANLTLNASGGNVGVGMAPTDKFHVAGNVRVTGGSFIDDGVTLNAPDYVFDESYKLMSLDELSSFIDANKHLPNVPSATDIKKSGLNMSQFQMRLLEKVEELTLYTLDQHAKIGTLNTQNAQLMERLAALEKQVQEKKQ